MLRIKNTFSAPVLVIAMLFILVGVSFLEPTQLAENDNIYLSFIIIQFLMVLLPSVFYSKLKGKGYSSVLGLSMFTPDTIAFIILATLTLISGGAAIRFVSEELGFARSNIILLNEIFDGVSDSGNPAYLLMSLAITPAIVEEFAFRGVLLTEYKSGGRVCALVMSSLFFAFLHYGFHNFLLAFFIGIMLSFTVYVTGSVWAAVIVRLVYNIYSLFLESQLFTVLDRPSNNIFMIFIFGGLFLIFTFMLLGCAEKMFYAYAVSGRETPVRDDSYAAGEVNFKNSLVSLPFILAFVFYIIISVGSI